MDTGCLSRFTGKGDDEPLGGTRMVDLGHNNIWSPSIVVYCLLVQWQSKTPAFVHNAEPEEPIVLPHTAYYKHKLPSPKEKKTCQFSGVCSFF